jgi:hypothetical protein
VVVPAMTLEDRASLKQRVSLIFTELVEALAAAAESAPVREIVDDSPGTAADGVASPDVCSTLQECETCYASVSCAWHEGACVQLTKAVMQVLEPRPQQDLCPET